MYHVKNVLNQLYNNLIIKQTNLAYRFDQKIEISFICLINNYDLDPPIHLP